MWLKMAVQIEIWADYESGHQISGMAVSLKICRTPNARNELHMLEHGATGSLRHIDERRGFVLPRVPVMQCSGATVTCCSEIE